MKKSQAALEFLTTYAWAFLVILIMVGALAYFGILNPGKLLPDRCNFPTEFGCLDYAITYGTTGADGTFTIRLKNSVGEPITIPDVTTDIVLSSDSSTPFSCTLATVDGTAVAALPSTPAYTWNTDDTIDFAFNTCNTLAAGFTSGDKAKATVNINYHLAKSSASFIHESEGEVFTTVP
jgi:hypothetical protein